MAAKAGLVALKASLAAEVVQAVMLELMQEHQRVVDPVVMDIHQQF